MALEKLARFLSRKDLPEEDKEILKGMQYTADMIDKMKGMKSTDGWKVLEEELKTRIQAGIRKRLEEDKELSAYVDILAVVETKSKEIILAEQVNQLLPRD